ncbi:hypothetical protein BY996DRAFT_7370355 [Phakopsora pachyrhizi]|nr:hypothetical protein BY996DRAFT_8008352 [Phakopsora pachyrhizi]KAI8450591.1 hypothetical protein BY996DRAFT_7370355 [Phakopsora pachyrhizi]
MVKAPAYDSQSSRRLQVRVLGRSLSATCYTGGIHSFWGIEQGALYSFSTESLSTNHSLYLFCNIFFILLLFVKK